MICEKCGRKMFNYKGVLYNGKPIHNKRCSNCNYEYNLRDGWYKENDS